MTILTVSLLVALVAGAAVVYQNSQQGQGLETIMRLAVGGAILTVSVVVGLVGGVAAILYQDSKQDLFTPGPDSLKNTNVLITGGNSGLGLESAKRLAVSGANLILTVQSEAKGKAAVKAVQEYLKEHGIAKNKEQRIEYRILNLDSLASVKEQVGSWLKSDESFQIDVLINNAGIFALPEREMTVDGLEKQMHVNHLGHFVLTALVKDRLSPNARIINIGSEAHKRAAKHGDGLDLAYAWTADSDYGGLKSYGQSKLANVLFTQELQRRVNEAKFKWTVVVVHPGIVATDAGRYLFSNPIIQNFFNRFLAFAASVGILRTVAIGATTQIWLAGTKDNDGSIEPGAYYRNYKVQKLADFATSQTSAELLWKESEQRSGVVFSLP